MKLFLLAGLIVISFSSCTKKIFAQDEREAEVKTTIDQLFTGMRLGDSTMVKAVFHKDARMHTIFKNKNGEIVLNEGSVQNFANAVGTPHKDVWNEVLDDIVVQIDGQLAQVWTPYRFFLNEDQFIHCGVNAFQLVNEAKGWQILQLTDTRQKEGCEPMD